MANINNDFSSQQIAVGKDKKYPLSENIYIDWSIDELCEYFAGKNWREEDTTPLPSSPSIFQFPD